MKNLNSKTILGWSICRDLSAFTQRLAVIMMMCMLCVGTAWAQENGTKQTVTLNANSGTVTPATMVCTEGQPFGDLPTPTRNGFTFAGWYKVPGHADTRVTNTTVYTHAKFGDMIHARWTKKTATLVFIGLDGKTEVGRITISGEGGSLPDISASTYKLNVDDDKFFAGYYTRINGEGERIYSGIANSANELHPAITHESTFAAGSTTYLYAFQTHVKHVTHWDYSYMLKDSEGERWVNLDQSDNDSRIQYGKLTFMNNAGEVLKWIYFQADGITNKTGMTDELPTHTASVGRFHLQLADATHAETANGATVIGDNTTDNDGQAGDWNVYFTDEQLSHFTKYNFEPIATPKIGETAEKSATNWLRTTDPVAHDTWFIYTGADNANNAPLNWTVKLTNLKVYPDYVIAKPLFTSNQNPDQWMEISQLANLDGVTCKLVSKTGEGDDTYATYKGSYPVWKTGSTGGYGYAIGMVGFEVDGQKVYLNQTKPGHFSTAFNSATAANPTSENRTSIWPTEGEEASKAFPEIYYTINAPSIPVIRFLPGSAPGAKLGGATPEIVWGAEGTTISGTEFTKYTASCPGCDFLGWSETDGATTPTYTNSYTFEGAKTLYPVWQDNEAPVIAPEKNPSCITDVKVSITDNLKVETVTVKKNGTDVTSEITITGSGNEKELTLPAPEKSTEVVSYVYTITVSDGTKTSTETVTIYSDHAWGAEIPMKDPTATENGSIVAYKICEHCGEYAFVNGTPMTEEEKKQNIIPAGSVLVKTDAGVTTRWDDEVNRAIDKINDSEGTGNNVVLTTNSNVETSIIKAPTHSTNPAILDLNGKGLLADDEPGNITGNADVIILLKDDGETEYTNLSKVNGTPIRYTRTFSEIQGGNWQAIYLPFIATGVNTVGEFGELSSLKLDEKGVATLTITKGLTELNAKTSYFVRHAAGQMIIDADKETDLLPYSIPEVVNVNSIFNISGSLTNSDHVSSNVKDFYVMTNGGKFAYVKGGQRQRPYRWVMLPINTQSIQLFNIIEDDDLTGVNGFESETNNNAPIYTLDGYKLPEGATLTPGVIYIQNGKAFKAAK